MSWALRVETNEMMLKRILEPEVMDSPQEARSYDAMDHEAVNNLFVDDFLSATEDFAGSVLDVGTGTARIPVVLCHRWPHCELTGIDLSRQMLQLAEGNIEAAGLASRISLAHTDAKHLPYDDNTFAAVISNSILHHIPQPARVLAEAVRVVKPGGILFWRDLIRPVDERTLDRLVEMYAGGENVHQQKLFRDSLWAAFCIDEMQELVSNLGFDPLSVQATSDRHWTWLARK